MKWLTDILKGFKLDVGRVIDETITNDEEKGKLKQQVLALLTGMQTSLAAVSAEVVKTEMKGSWLQRNWRPILMMVFAGLLVARWFGYTIAIDQSLELELMSIIKIGLGGYVVGRSAEKIVDTASRNIDLTFLKRKDRKEAYK